VEHKGGRDAEGHQVGQRVQLASERLARARAAGDAAVDRIEDAGDGDGDRRLAQRAVSGEHDREEARAEAAAGDHVGRVDELFHVVPPAAR